VTFLKLAVIFVAAMLVQWWWSTHGTIWGVAPQLLLVLTVALAARQGPVRAMFFGFLWGLFLDTLAGRLVGANALALTMAAYGAGSVRRQIDLMGVGPQCVTVFGLTWAYFLIIGLIGLVFLKSFLWVGWASFLIDPFYNCLITVILFVLWNPLPERLERR
jgi:rod shape-determining protein MreD